ncbi:MAG: hypothetical protein IJ643_09615 [Eubacterium sp.]|nr:hypothetical protein [Eubacterium sp.]
MKKTIICFVTALLVIATLSACTGSSSTDVTENNTTETSSQITSDFSEFQGEWFYSTDDSDVHSEHKYTIDGEKVELYDTLETPNGTGHTTKYYTLVLDNNGDVFIKSNEDGKKYWRVEADSEHLYFYHYTSNYQTINITCDRID